jgi:hypothetical protein
VSCPQPEKVVPACTDDKQEQAREKETNAGGSGERYGFGAFLLRPKLELYKCRSTSWLDT